MAVALGVFTAAGFWLDHGAASESGAYAAALASSFHLSPWLLLVPLATGILIARKLPAIITLFCAVVFACVAMLLAQPDLVARVAGVSSLDFMSGFKGCSCRVSARRLCRPEAPNSTRWSRRAA